MADPGFKKQAFLDWLPNGDATFPSSKYSFWAGAMSFADTSSTPTVAPRKIVTPENTRGSFDPEGEIAEQNEIKKDDPNWNLPSDFLYSWDTHSVLSTNMQITRENIIGALKWTDVLIQVFSGTLIFGAIQNAGEWLRDAYKDKTGPFAWFARTSGVVIASTGRLGLFFTQILAGAIRLPFAILSGTLGLLWGVGVAITNKQPLGRSMLAGMIDFIWPFAPKTAYSVQASAVLHQMQIAFPKVNTQAAYQKKSANTDWNLIIGVLSMAIAITLVVLLATGTFGIGLAALPAVKAIGGGIATALNAAFGWAGFSAGVASTTPVLSSLVNWVGLGVIGKKIALATMLVGAVSTFLSNSMNAVKDYAFSREGGGSPPSSKKNSKEDNQNSDKGSNNNTNAKKQEKKKDEPIVYVNNNDNDNDNDNNDLNSSASSKTMIISDNITNGITAGIIKIKRKQ